MKSKEQWKLKKGMVKDIWHHWALTAPVVFEGKATLLRRLHKSKDGNEMWSVKFLESGAILPRWVCYIPPIGGLR